MMNQMNDLTLKFCLLGSQLKYLSQVTCDWSKIVFTNVLNREAIYLLSPYGTHQNRYQDQKLINDISRTF